MRVSGGNPAGFPDFKPINPWGRPVPKPVRPIQPKPLEERLYQLVVKWNGQLRPIGPRAPKDFVERLLYEINMQIALGKELFWTEPHLVEVR